MVALRIGGADVPVDIRDAGYVRQAQGPAQEDVLPLPQESGQRRTVRVPAHTVPSFLVDPCSLSTGTFHSLPDPERFAPYTDLDSILNNNNMQKSYRTFLKIRCYFFEIFTHKWS